MSLAKLTSLSTQTLSLLLERQRLVGLGAPPPASSTQHIARNLTQLRTGILELEASFPESKGTAHGQGQREAAGLLRNQFERMRDMLGADGVGVIEPLPAPVEDKPEQPEASSSSPSPPPQKDVIYAPYSDDPSPSPGRDADPHELLQEQRFLMDEQDAHLDRLTHSIGRQRDISLQINDELDVHTGLLEELDTDLDQTHNRLSGAARRLQTFSRGVRGNCSTYTIAALIFVLLILIIIFKT